MALGRLGIWRNDWVFGASFLLTRVGFHCYGVTRVWPLECMTTYKFFMSLTVALHLYWGYSWIAGQIKRVARRGKKTAAGAGGSSMSGAKVEGKGGASKQE